MTCPAVKCGVVVLATVVCLMSGCGGVRLYSETRDKQGQATRQAWSEVDIGSTIARERENLTTLLSAEQATAGHLYLAERDHLIRSVATGSSVKDALITPTSNALVALTSDASLAERWVGAWEAEQDNADQQKKYFRFFEQVGIEPPSCDALTKPDVDVSTSLENWIAQHPDYAEAMTAALEGREATEKTKPIKGLRELCREPARTATRPLQIGGALQSVRDDLASSKDSLEAARSATLKLRYDYLATVAAHERALASLGGNEESRALIEKTANTLEVYVSALGHASDMFSVQFLAKERRDSLEAFLTTVANPAAADPDNSSKAALALVLLPNTFDETRKALAKAKEPLLVPLVIQKNIEQINLDAAERDIAAQEALVGLKEDELAIMTKQVSELLKASALFRERVAARDAASPVAEVLRPTRGEKTGESRHDLVIAIALYLDAEGRLSAEAEEYRLRIDSIDHERALSLAEANAMQWASLTGTVVDQVALYGTTGIKAEQVVALVNSLALLWIGQGVN